jgi:hypothetical protein
MEPELQLAMNVLLAPNCQCGRVKQVRQAICSRCWKRLPVDVRNALYRKVGGGFKAAYEAACAALRGTDVTA